MPFIGNQPAKVPLTSADITDGIIVNADISSTAGITLNKLSGNPNFRNIVINGDMQIAQRSTSVASITTSGYYTLDRFQTVMSSLGTWTMSQSTDVPSGYGFAKSLKLDCTTADASPSAGDILYICQIVEGQNLQYLKKGTANAQSLTLSFWVKSTKTGTFIAQLLDGDNTRSISKSYTVSASNTWEFKTVTFSGDTTGAFDNDNAGSLQLNFWLGAGTTYTSGTLQTTWGTQTNANMAVGQVNIADSTANDFLITGVQLEAGTSATDFEFLPIDVSLARCYRYYQKLFNSGAFAYPSAITLIAAGTTVAYGPLSFLTPMRTTPTYTSSGNLRLVDQGTGFAITSSAIDGARSGTQNVEINFGVASGLVQFRPYHVENNNDATASLNFSAEL